MTHVAWKNHANGARNARGPVPLRGPEGEDRRWGRPGRRTPRGVRLLGRVRRLGVRPDRPLRGRRRYRRRPMYVKALSIVAGPASGPIDPSYDSRPSTRSPVAPPTPTSRQVSMIRARRSPGRGPRLLHADRAGSDGGPGILRARTGVARRTRRLVRAWRATASESRRRAEVVWAPDRRQRSADAVRVLASVPRRGRRPPAGRAPTGDDPQPGSGPERACRSFRSLAVSAIGESWGQVAIDGDRRPDRVNTRGTEMALDRSLDDPPTTKATSPVREHSAPTDTSRLVSLRSAAAPSGSLTRRSEPAPDLNRLAELGERHGAVDAPTQGQPGVGPFN